MDNGINNGIDNKEKTKTEKELEREIEIGRPYLDKVKGKYVRKSPDIRLLEAKLEGYRLAKEEFNKKVEELKKVIEDWNYLGTAREPVYNKGKRMKFKDTNKKVYKIGRNDFKELIREIDKIFKEEKSTEKEIIEKVLGKYRWVDEEIPLQEIIEKALKFQKEEFNKKVEELKRNAEKEWFGKEGIFPKWLNDEINKIFGEEKSK